MDDILSGAYSKDESLEHVNQVSTVLSHGGFSLKFVAQSGEDPPDKASSDGKSLKILGYRWFTKADILSPGFEEVNFNRKHRGAKKPNPFPVISPEDVGKLLDSTKITRRLVVSKVAEIFDPVGLWEPYKLQLKLEQSDLKDVGWDVELSEDLQHECRPRLLC